MASRSSSQARNIQWQRRLFIDHPSKGSDPSAKTAGGKTKVICMLCLENHILLDQNQDLVAGREQRGREVLQMTYFNADKDAPGRLWMEERPDVLLRHLSTCDRQPDSVKNAANVDLEQRRKKQATRLVTPASSGPANPPVAGPGPSSLQFPYSPNPDLYTFNLGSGSSPSPAFGGDFIPAASGSSPSGFHWDSAHQRTYSFDDLRSANRSSSPSSPAFSDAMSVDPADSISQVGSTGFPILSRQPSSHGLGLENARKRQRMESGSLPASPSPGPVLFSAAAQTEFEMRIARITASAGFPLAWVENPEVIEFFKVEKGFLRHCKTATDLITWLRSKTFVLALLRKVQHDTNSPVLAIIRAVLTRWTSHYLAFSRLLEIAPPLKLLVSQEELRGTDNQIITGDSKAKARARAMVRTIQNPNFWDAVQRMKTHLQPLAFAANITQAAFCRLDEVLFTFGHLFRHFDRLSETADRRVRQAVLASIERRWAKCDQDVFIAAAIFNPFVDMQAFKKVPILQKASILELSQRLHKRFFGAEADYGVLLQNIDDFFLGRGSMENLAKFKQAVRLRAAQEKRKPHPLDVYDAFTIPGHDMEDPPLIRLARRVLSITANSASCERLFSVFGATLTKLRNRLSTKTLSNLAELKMLIRDEHVRNGQAKERLRRKFAQVGTDVVSAPDSVPVPPTAPPPSNEEISVADVDAETTTAAVPSEFEQMAEDLAKSVDNDEDLDDTPTHPGPDHISITIAELFDFSKLQVWVHEHETHAQNALDEEMALYELVDAGATVDEVTVEVDPTVAAVLDIN